MDSQTDSSSTDIHRELVTAQRPTLSSSQLEREASTSPDCSNHLPPSQPDISDVDLTPPTSASGLSSQEGPPSLAHLDGGHHHHHHDARSVALLQLQRGQSEETRVSCGRDGAVDSGNDDQEQACDGGGGGISSSSSSSSDKNNDHVSGAVDCSAALKRTSSGFVKRSSIRGTEDILPEMGGGGKRPGHRRNSSILSNGSSITEVSKTRRFSLFLFLSFSLPLPGFSFANV